MSKGLEGLKVLELGGGIPAATATKLLADLGATVVKVEPPGGDPVRRRAPFRNGTPDPECSGVFLNLNANKRSIVLDYATPAGRDRLDPLAREADILIHGFQHRELAALGIDQERFSAVNPGLVVVAITPFGLSGPYRDYAAADLQLIHAGGWGYLCPQPGSDPALPPIKPFGQHALVQAGLHAACVALAAQHAATRDGVGERIDLSVQEVVALLLGKSLLDYTYAGRVFTRLGKRANCPSGFFPCKDTDIFIHVSEEAQWKRLVTLLGKPELAEREGFHPREVRGENAALVEAELKPLLAKWSAEELFVKAQENRICACQTFRYEGLTTHEHLRARGFVVPHEHPRAGKLVLPGAPYRLDHGWWNIRRPAPLLGEANAEQARAFGAADAARAAWRAPRAAPAGGQPGRPLAGVRVLDFTWVWAGPYATLLLASLGAEVLKVESKHRPDRTRRAINFPQELGPGLDHCGTFNNLCQAKQSVSLNLSHPEGVAQARALARSCDVVISNFGTGVMEKLGMGREALHAANPHLVICAISGFGQTGPYRHFTGYGQAIVAQGGVSAQTGYEGGKPTEVATAYGDPNAGVYAAFAIIAALAARERFGGGQFIDVSLWETMVATGFEGWMNHTLGNLPYQPMGDHDPYWAPHNLYRCAGQDAWVALACTEEGHWQALSRAIGRPELADDPRFRSAALRKRHERELDALLGAWCAPRDPWSVTRALQAAGVPSFPSLDMQQLAEDPHLKARDYLMWHHHPKVGVRATNGMPWRFVNRPWVVPGRAPLLGEHTEAVLETVAGLTPAEIARLREEHALE
ncbi:MAG: CoA transferase [Candidatus Lambdaproteobacteria bacterium]|nr:CoA transferase [Candidatus Lambdaproteobacteria bacterium]